MPIPALAPSGLLPLGRWVATPEEVYSTFVSGHGAVREKVWTDWIELTTALREIVPVPAAWLGGSLLSSKAEPGDVDSVYLVEWRHLAVAKVDQAAANFLQIVASNSVKSALKLSVDSFILEWAPLPGVAPSALAGSYLGDRGYWDDLWTRQRSADARAAAIPKRGYLEVILDGYV